MRTLSIDLRKRILESYDNGEGTRQEVAKRFKVSLGMVKKLLQQRRRIGEIGAQHHRSGSKAQIVEEHLQRMKKLISKEPDLTLKELGEALGLKCSQQALHYALKKIGLTYKKRHCAPANKSVRT